MESTARWNSAPAFQEEQQKNSIKLLLFHRMMKVYQAWLI